MILFPIAPAVGDRHSDAARTWEWDGAKWNVVAPDFFAEYDPTRTYEVGESFVFPGSQNAGGSHVYQVIVGPTIPGTDPISDPLSFEMTLSASGRMRGYMDSTVQDGGPLVPGPVVSGDPAGVYNLGDYVIVTTDSNQLYDTTTGSPTSGPTANGIRLFRGDRLVIDLAKQWLKLDPPERNAWGLFDSTVAGGGTGIPQPVINGSRWYLNHDLVTVNIGGRYNFNTGLPDPAGELLKQGQLLIYDGTDFTASRSIENFFTGFFDPTSPGGGPDLADPVIDGTAAYFSGEYVIGSAAGSYNFTTGLPSAAPGARLVNPSDHIIYDGANWSVLTAANSPARGFMDPTVTGGSPPAPFPIINGSTDYSADDYVFVQGAGSYNFITGLPGSGVALVQGDKLVYTGAVWLKQNIAGGMLKGQFDPTIANGGPAVDHPVLNGSIEYAARDTIYAIKSGWYVFGTGAVGPSPTATWVRKGFNYAFNGAIWQAVVPDGSTNWGWFDPTVNGGGTTIPTVTNSATLAYVTDDWFTVLQPGNYNFVTGLTDPAGTALVAGDVIRFDPANTRWQIYSAGAGGGNTTIDVTQNAHGFVVGMPIYIASNGTWARAVATNAANLKTATVAEVSSANTFKAMTSGILRMPAHGLTRGAVYYLGTGAGGYSSTAPSATNQFIQPHLTPISLDDVEVHDGATARRI